MTAIRSRPSLPVFAILLLVALISSCQIEKRTGGELSSAASNQDRTEMSEGNLSGLDAESSDQAANGQQGLSNAAMREYAFLDCMYSDSYFPRDMVDQTKAILIDFC